MHHAFEAGDRLQAYHTNAPALTPAAYEDFGRAVDTLLRLGRFDEAVQLWADCVEIQHFPPVIIPTSYQRARGAWRPAGVQGCPMC